MLAVRADRMLKTLKHARLTQSHEAELRKLLAIDLLIIDDFGLDAMDAPESRDASTSLSNGIALDATGWGRSSTGSRRRGSSLALDPMLGLPCLDP